MYVLVRQSVSLHDVADETGSGYGVEIAQLQKSSGMLDKAFKLAHRYIHACMRVCVCELGIPIPMTPRPVLGW